MGAIQGLHRAIVELGLRWGILLFITSEVFFFVRFFWAYFHARLSPNIEVGSLWPPAGINPFNPFGVPLLNTIILISSGVRVTWAHHALIEGNYRQTRQGLGYYEARFTFADRVYGSTFFIATGFHGLHVIVGTIFLIVTRFRHTKGEFSAA